MRPSKYLEEYGAITLTVFVLAIALVVRYGFKAQFFIPEDPRCILTTVITVSAIAVGFIATAKSVMLTMRNSKAGKNLDKYKLFGICMVYFMASIKGLLLFTVISACGLFIPSKTDLRWLVDLFCLSWLSAAVWAGSLTWRTLWIYEAFAKKVSE